MERKSRKPPEGVSARKPVLSDRINTAINGLIHHFVPEDPNEDEAEAQRRHDYCFRMVRTTLETPMSADLATDVNHTMDLIRKKLTVDRPNDAWLFSQLYSRLLALPVLNQKWAILYMLYQLADSTGSNDPTQPLLGMHEPQDQSRQDPSELDEADDEPSQPPWKEVPTTASPVHQQQQQRQRQAAGRASQSLGSRQEQDALDEAFSRGGLKRFPPDKARRGPEEAAAAEKAAEAAAEERERTDRERAKEREREKGTEKTEKERTEKTEKTRDVSLKSALLADSQRETEPSETALLRDVLFTLQGLDSATMVFCDRSEPPKTKKAKPMPVASILVLPSTLPAPTVALLHALAEPALLYRRLDAFVREPADGLLGQSLRAAISSELRSYLGLVATLESQIRRALVALEQGAPRQGIGRAGVTLKRCVVWTREATMGLRLLSVIAEESASKHGGQLISLIHGFSTSHGDPTVGAFAERLLGPVARPFYEILRRWIYDGELADPYREFFVREQQQYQQQQQSQSQSQKQKQAPKKKDRRAALASGHSSVWNDKYEMDAGMIPSIMAAEFAEKVFLIGKSLNFLRHSCGDAAWVEAYSKGASKELRYGDTATLEAWIDEAHKTTMRRLMGLLTDKFRLFEHLAALKKYVLLGQGDFVALLMESLAPNLDRPATAQYRHTLTSQLDHAIQGSSARFEPPDILRHLDARMLQQSHGDTGWDCFTLEYKIPSPVDCIVTEWATKQYLKVFNFLWHVKRVEFALASTWHKCITGARAGGILHVPDDYAADAADAGPDAITAARVRHIWNATRATLAEMVHLVGQLQYYILFEVIEASWDTLQTAIRRDDCTLDALIAAHSDYLTSITHKGLLGVRRRAFVEMKHAAAQAQAQAAAAAAAGDDASTLPAPLPEVPAEDANGFPAQLKELLRTMLSFRDCVDGLYSWAVSDFTRRQEADVLRGHQKSSFSSAPAAAEAWDEANTAGGANTTTAAAAPVESELPALQLRLQSLAKSFRKRVIYLLADLGYQKDTDLRFLAVAMNFNDVYVVPQGKRHQKR